MKIKKIWLIAVFWVSSANAAYNGPIIDAHSQIDEHVNRDEILSLMDRAGVEKIFLSTRGKVTVDEMLELHESSPRRIKLLVRTKSKAWQDGNPSFYSSFNNQLRHPEYVGLAELILWHAKKGNKAPKWEISILSPQATEAIDAALSRDWPVILHYEFRASKELKEALMAQMESVLRKHPDHPFLLIHAGQLSPKEVRALFQSHENLSLMLSWTNPIATSFSKQPWSKIFNRSGDFKKGWKSLILDYPARFILNFDNVFENHWGDMYVEQVRYWREALGYLPDDVASLLAHGNARKLWKITD
jgi:predicted TIM-barrel fold metal-dependent hydrolase